MENQKKILIFSTAYYPFVGGAEVAVKEITDRIHEVQFDLITARFTKNLPKSEKIGNVNVYRVGFGWGAFDKIWLALFGAKKAYRLHKKNKYYLAWSIMASQASIAAAKFKHKAPEVKLVLTMQEGDEEEYLKRYVLGIDFLYNLLIKPWHTLVFKNADQGTAISSSLIERILGNGASFPIELIPNGVNVEEFQKEISKEEKIRIREELRLEENDIALVTASRLVEKNGIEDVIKAVFLLPQNFKFIIFGEGELEDKLKKVAKSLEVSERVIFKGFVSHSELPKYLKACDIFIRPSLSEGFGNSFIEAFVCRLPVIATPVGGIVDFLVGPAELQRSGIGGQTGYFCQPQNPESIASTVQKLISDPNMGQVVENAYQLALEKYDWGQIAREMKEVFNQS